VIHGPGSYLPSDGKQIDDDDDDDDWMMVVGVVVVVVVMVPSYAKRSRHS